MLVARSTATLVARTIERIACGDGVRTSAQSVVGGPIYLSRMADLLVRSSARLVGDDHLGVCTFKNIRELPTLLHPRKVSKAPDRFGDARVAYLRTDWVRAEALLQECLAIEERDPPALLMLAAVYRQTNRFESCRVCIEKLRTTEVADRWWLEVDAEERRLQRDLAFHQASGRVSRPSMHQNQMVAEASSIRAAA